MSFLIHYKMEGSEGWRRFISHFGGWLHFGFVKVFATGRRDFKDPVKHARS